MQAAVLVAKLTRAAVLAGNLCAGDDMDPMPPDCLRVLGAAQCSLPGDMRIQGDAIFVQWLEGSPAFAVTARGKARVHRGQEVFSADDARLVIQQAETTPVIRDAYFTFRPGGIRDPRCE